MGATCKHWARQVGSTFQKPICSDCPRRAEIIANRKAKKMTTATVSVRSSVQHPTPDRQAARDARVAADLAALRKELETERQAVTKATEVKATSPAPTPKPLPEDPYRPKAMEEVVGQTSLVRRLKVVLHGARLRETQPPHCLFIGPSGFGKTTLAQVVSTELALPLIQTTGMMFRKSTDVVALVVQQTGPVVVFVDEVHQAKRAALDSLLTVMESGTLDLLGNGEATQHKVPGLVVVAATTDPGLLPSAFRSRFGFTGALEPYSDDELARIVSGVFDKREMPFLPSEALEVARRSRGVPRTAVQLAERVLDFAAVSECDKIADGDVHAALSLFGISPDGLMEADLSVLRVLTKVYAGKPVGLAALAMQANVQETTLTETIEPFLASRGFLLRTQRGRMATRAAYELMETA